MIHVSLAEKSNLFLLGHVGAPRDVQVRGAVDDEADAAGHLRPRVRVVGEVGDAVGAEHVDRRELEVRHECLPRETNITTTLHTQKQ